ncbi:hypothetical protein GN956_G23113 [Arapaima gigas]
MRTQQASYRPGGPGPHSSNTCPVSYEKNTCVDLHNALIEDRVGRTHQQMPDGRSLEPELQLPLSSHWSLSLDSHSQRPTLAVLGLIERNTQKEPRENP